MSPTLGSALTVALCPDSLGLVVRRRRKVLRSDCIDVAPVDGPPWLGTIETLRQWLGANPLMRVRASFILSSRFVRYAVVDWPPAALSRGESMVWERKHLEATYGDMTGWTIVCDRGAYGHSYVASAVQHELLQALRETVASARMGMGNITPAFVSGWNRWRHRAKPGEFFGMGESERFVLGCLGLRGWESLRVLSTPVDTDRLTALVLREHVLLGKLNAPITWMHTSGGLPKPSNLNAPSNVHWISSEQDESSPALALARLAAGV